MAVTWGGFEMQCRGPGWFGAVGAHAVPVWNLVGRGHGRRGRRGTEKDEQLVRLWTSPMTQTLALGRAQPRVTVDTSCVPWVLSVHLPLLRGGLGVGGGSTLVRPKVHGEQDEQSRGGCRGVNEPHSSAGVDSTQGPRLPHTSPTTSPFQEIVSSWKSLESGRAGTPRGKGRGVLNERGPR